ncbi:hypothetical protein [Geopseudomonas aromaticivorans]
MSWIYPSDLRTILSQHGITIGRPALLVAPGVGPMYATIKKLPSGQEQVAGRLSVIHMDVPMLPRIGGLNQMTLGDPSFDNMRFNGRNELLEDGFSTMSQRDIEVFWNGLAQAYERAVILPVTNFEDLHRWAFVHDRALVRLKASQLPGQASIAQEFPDVFAAVCAAADGYHRRLVEHLECELHAAEPDRYPAEQGWLDIPAGSPATAREQVPIKKLLETAPAQIAALEVRRAAVEPAYEFDPFSMDL